MTTEQQKEFIDAIQNKIDTKLSKFLQDPNESEKAFSFRKEDTVKELKWVLTQFNQIKNK